MGGKGGGGWGDLTEVNILYPKKSQLQNLSTQKKSLFFFSTPKKIPWSFFRNPKRSLCFFFVTQKNPGIFRRLKNIIFGQNVRPPSLKYASGAPGVFANSSNDNLELLIFSCHNTVLVKSKITNTAKQKPFTSCTDLN